MLIKNITRCVFRWQIDLNNLLAGLLTDPFAVKKKLSWKNQLQGDIGAEDIHYSIFLVVLSIIPAAFVAGTSVDVQWRVFAKFFGVPLNVVIHGFLTAVILFAGSYFHKTPKPWSAAYKLMLRVMAIYPFLVLLSYHRWQLVLSILIYGFFVIRGVQMAYPIPLRNNFLFYGTIYLMFALTRAFQHVKDTFPR